jgi:hypothetical protein
MSAALGDEVRAYAVVPADRVAFRSQPATPEPVIDYLSSVFRLHPTA